MPTNNILLFDQNKGNMLNDSAYNTNQQRLNGVQSGIASSQLQNKFQYQVSLVAYAIASIMYNNGMDANDADAVSAFVSNMSNTLVQKVLDKASKQEAQAGTVDTKWMSPSLVKAAIDYFRQNAVTFENTVTLNGDPTSNLQAATKQYVDNQAGSKLNWNVAETKNINFTISSSSSKNYYQVSSPSIPASATVVKIYLYANSKSGNGSCRPGSYNEITDTVSIPSSGSGIYFGLLRYANLFLTGDGALVGPSLFFIDSNKNSKFSGYATWYYI